MINFQNHFTSDSILGNFLRCFETLTSSLPQVKSLSFYGRDLLPGSVSGKEEEL